MAPEIVRRIVVLWTAGYPTWTARSNIDSFNLVQDVPAAQVLFDCGAPLIYLPGFYVGSQLRISLPEMEQWVRGYGAMGDYLYWLYTHNPIQRMMGIDDHFGRTWVIWDLINIAWLLNPGWAPSEVGPAARLRDDTTWEAGKPGGRLMREAYGVDRDAIFREFFLQATQGGRPRMTEQPTKRFRSIMEISAAEWLAALKLPAADIPDVVIVEGSWWRAARTAWRLSHLEDVRKLAFPDIFWGR